MFLKLALFILPIFLSGQVIAQKVDALKPDFTSAQIIPGMKLVWSDEFNMEGKPDSSKWRYEHGFARNQELQWYQPDNATCKNGVLLISGRREQVKNPNYVAGSPDWKLNREYANYTSASLQTRNLGQWQFGRYEIRARIDTSMGSWPAIWTLGVSGTWPANGEIDIMEFYRVKHVPTILANFAWLSGQPGKARWDDTRTPLSKFTARETDWPKKFHTWRMDWNKDSIGLYLDDELLNSTLLKEAVNPDGSTPFLQPHYLLLNLALGGNGDDPSQTKFPVTYEVDYVRIYQQGK